MHGCSVTQSCLTLCDPMDYNPPDYPALNPEVLRATERTIWKLRSLLDRVYQS